MRLRCSYVSVNLSLQGYQKERKHASSFLKSEKMKNYHKAIEAGARPSPGLKSADFHSSAAGLEAMIFISHAFVCWGCFEMGAVTVCLFADVLSCMSFNTDWHRASKLRNFKAK